MGILLVHFHFFTQNSQNDFTCFNFGPNLQLGSIHVGSNHRPLFKASSFFFSLFLFFVVFTVWGNEFFFSWCAKFRSFATGIQFFVIFILSLNKIIDLSRLTPPLVFEAKFGDYVFAVCSQVNIFSFRLKFSKLLIRKLICCNAEKCFRCFNNFHFLFSVGELQYMLLPWKVTWTFLKFS